MNPHSMRILQSMRILTELMIETLERDRDTARYDDLYTRLVGEFEALTANEGRCNENLR